MSRASDQIVLTLPGRPRLRGVATLVLGGVGSRIDLPYEKVDDLQLAVLSVLSANTLETVTIEVEVGEERVVVGVGPLPEGAASDRGLQRVLERLVDTVEATTRDDAGSTGQWLVLGLSRSQASGE